MFPTFFPCETQRGHLFAQHFFQPSLCLNSQPLCLTTTSCNQNLECANRRPHRLASALFPTLVKLSCKPFSHHQVSDRGWPFALGIADIGQSEKSHFSLSLARITSHNEIPSQCCRRTLTCKATDCKVLCVIVDGLSRLLFHAAPLKLLSIQANAGQTNNIPMCSDLHGRTWTLRKKMRKKPKQKT